MGRRDAAWLVLLALLVRLPLWWWVSRHETPPLYDEAVYLELAEGWSRGDLAAALGDGRWPPLHPMVLGLGLRFVGGLAGARLVGVILGALTTGLVYAFSRRLAGRRSAFVAGVLSAVAPAFLFYSHSLWSESLALFIASASLIAAVDCRRRLGLSRPFALPAALGGLGLGALALTRVALVTWIVAVPVWIALASGGARRRRFSAGALCLVSSLAVLAPWLAVQKGRFEHVGLSTLSGYNLALGNNGRVPQGYGSSWAHRRSTLELQRELRRLAADRGFERPELDWPKVASELALAEVEARPLAALGRVPIRLWLLMAPDVLPVRHFLRGVYPALPPPLLAVAVAAIVAAHLLMLAVGVYGVLVARFRRHSASLSLLLGLAAATALPPAFTVSATRLFLPIELLLLPAIGAVWAGRRRQLHRPWLAPAVALLAAAASLAALPRVAELYWQPAAQRSAPWLDRMLSPLGVETLYSDRYRLEKAPDDAASSGGELRVRIVGARVAPRPWLDADANSNRWPATLESFDIDVLSSGLEGSAIEVVDAAGRVRARWQLDEEREELGRRRPLRRGDLQLTWLGGGISPR